MSAPAPVAAVQSGLSDAGGAVAGVLGDVVISGVDIARDILGSTSDLADDLFPSGTGKSSGRGVIGKLVVALAALAVLAAVFALLRRMRGGASEEPSSTFPSPASVREASAANGTKDRAATPVS